MSRPPHTTRNMSVPATPLQILPRCSPISAQTLLVMGKHGVSASSHHTAAVAPPHTAPRFHFLLCGRPVPRLGARPLHPMRRPKAPGAPHH